MGAGNSAIALNTATYHIKAYLVPGDSFEFGSEHNRKTPAPKEKDVRRFAIAGENNKYWQWHSTLMEVFKLDPKTGSGVKLFWRDSDGDFIKFSSDRELIEAIGCMKEMGDVFHIYVSGESNFFVTD